MTSIKKCCNFWYGIDQEATMIIGIANAGLVGSISANYIIEHLDLKEVAYLYSDLFPPISVFLDGILKHPFRIYSNVNKEPAKVFVATTELPLGRDSYHNVAHTLMDFCEEHGIKTVVTLVGIPVQEVENYDLFFAAEPDVLDKLKDIDGLQPLPKGMIFGMEALVLNETLEREKLMGFSLISPVREYLPDIRASASLINGLNKIFSSINIDIQELLDRDEMLQMKLRELAEQIQRQKQSEYHAPPPSKNVNSLFT
ncbi:MAG: proteasome assembly chaperone family protein [Promethearchaeota archaeon]